ncbi:MAG TPA: CPBP family intramembrane metalloprotease, partial [Bacteroidales bacterium]|nr:CPBP family intramembrane metalloprotease [Bacteroidales bacterium]
MDANVRFPYRFFIITFVFAWVLWTPLVLGSLKIIFISDKLLSFLTMPMIMLGAFGPLAGALFALNKDRVDKTSTVKYLRSFLDLHLGWKGYIMPVIILGSSTFIAWFLPELFGEKRLPMLLPSVWVFVPYVLIMMFLGGGQEEFGWRGYALPLLEKQFGIWYANILLGVIWACWHLPLWFITGSNQIYMNFGGFILLLVGYSFIFSWIRKISGNRPFSGLYTHGLANAFIPLMPILILQNNIPQPRFW